MAAAEVAAQTVARRPLVSRLSAGHVVMLLAGLLGALLTLAAVRRAEATVPVVVARAPIAAGTAVSAELLGTTEIRADEQVLATLLRRSDVDGVDGLIATAPIAEGALVARSDLRPSSAGAAPRSMSFPIPRSRAVGGDLTAGDRVDVVATDRRTGRADYVLVNAEVLAVEADAGSGPLRGGSDEMSITVAVGGAGALRLAQALDGGTVILVRSTGAAALTRARAPGESSGEEVAP